MESSIAVFLMWQLACEQLPTRGQDKARAYACCDPFRDARQGRTHVVT